MYFKSVFIKPNKFYIFINNLKKFTKNTMTKSLLNQQTFDGCGVPFSYICY